MTSKFSWRRAALSLLAGAALCCFLVTAHFTLAQDDGKSAEAAATTETAAPETPPAGTAEPAPPARVPKVPDPDANVDIKLDSIWVLITGFLVMWMQAGFALVETGLTRAKNATNICMKNLLDYCFGSVAFWVVGFAMMFGDGGGFVGIPSMENICLPENFKWSTTGGFAAPVIPVVIFFFFQLVFAATAATIVSGAMAERTKFSSYMAYSFIISAFIYPISGHWIWGGGWLAEMGFWDFAGSTVVHSLGGWLSLAGAFILGPRLGKYDRDGKARAIPGHNLVLVTLGVFILYLGWFGFNPGSTLGIGNPSLVGRVVLTTNIAGAVGGLAALFTAKVLFKKWEATMALNGVLAGLVAVTAGCAWISMLSAIIIGLVAGILVVFAVLFFEHTVKVDDPVGAISVHGVCGAFGTLCVGLFSDFEVHKQAAAPADGLFISGSPEQLIKQAIGVGAVMAWGLATGAICFLLLKFTIGLRVTAEEEREGLDYGEHGNEAYHGFQFVEESL